MSPNDQDSTIYALVAFLKPGRHEYLIKDESGRYFYKEFVSGMREQEIPNGKFSFLIIVLAIAGP